MSNQKVAGVILAAGKGTRMKSDLPKGLHPVCGIPMVEHIGRAMRQAGISPIVVVIGHGGEEVQAQLGDQYLYAWQREQHGTGHAMQMAAPLLADHEGIVVVAPGDAPLASSETFQQLIDGFQTGQQCLIASSVVDVPKGYGRIVRGDDGKVERIVEEKDATPEQRQIREVNSAIYCFDAKSLVEEVPKLRNDNVQGEYYLTDLVATFAQNAAADALVYEDADILVGVNDRWQLAQADKKLRQRILKKHAESGVTLLDPDTIYIGVDVELGVDTVLEPNTMIVGKTRVGAGCRIGPFTRIEDCEIGDRVNIYVSYLKEARIHDEVKIGPFAHIRPASELHSDVKIGNFVETKNAVLAENVKVNHLSYIGDASVGANTNIGAGTITCNYDGYNKHRTEIGQDVFIGSNNTLLAPLQVGDGTITAAGSVVTSGEYPPDALVVGRARTEVKEQWAALWRNKKKKH